MPTAYIEKLAEEGHGSVAELEKKWEEAKALAKTEGKTDDYAYITSIFKNKVGISSVVIKAAVRLYANKLTQLEQELEDLEEEIEDLKEEIADSDPDEEEASDLNAELKSLTKRRDVLKESIRKEKS